MKPAWASQIPNGDYKFIIGDYANYIRCDSHLEYFLSEGTYQPQHNLDNQRLVHLSVCTLTGEQETNMPCISFQTGVDDFNENFILDIDLDFFSTANPFLKILSKSGAYEQIKKIFKADLFDKTFDADIDSEQLTTFTVKRVSHLGDLESIFRQLNDGIATENLLWPDGLSSAQDELLALIATIKDNYSLDEIQWMTVFDAGCTFDSNELPHHISTDVEIENLVESFGKFLKSLIYTPSIITISRSSDDDYCPADQVERIQRLVLETIFKVYGEKVNQNPIFHYKDDEWSV